jgi:predicted GNAT family acetyltransferase
MVGEPHQVTAATGDLEVRLADNPAESRYEAHIGDELAGAVYYEMRRADHIVFIHTEVDDKFEGHGVGGKLARFALDDARAHGLKVTPLCPFVSAWMKRHPEYEDLHA